MAPFELYAYELYADEPGTDELDNEDSPVDTAEEDTEDGAVDIADEDIADELDAGLDEVDDPPPPQALKVNTNSIAIQLILLIIIGNDSQ